MSAADTLLARLAGVKSTGKNRWMARCPAHEDSSPSLSIRATEDGRVLVHDFGGCEVDSVLQALNLTLSDLFEVPLGHHFAPVSHSGFTARELLTSIAHETFVARLILEAAKHSLLSEEANIRLDRALALIARACDLSYEG